MASNSDKIANLVQQVYTVAQPVLVDSKAQIVSSAPWALRIPLKMAFPWFINTLLPIIIRLSIEALLGRYGVLIAGMLTFAMPSLEKIFSQEVVIWLKLLVGASETQIEHMDEAVQKNIVPLKKWSL